MSEYVTTLGGIKHGDIRLTTLHIAFYQRKDNQNRSRSRSTKARQTSTTKKGNKFPLLANVPFLVHHEAVTALQTNQTELPDIRTSSHGLQTPSSLPL